MKKSFVLVLLLLAAPAVLYAHGMNVKVSVDETGLVEGTATYSGGHEVANATVTVTDADGKEVYRGKTDKNGRFEFSLKCRSSYTVKVRQGSHLGKTTIKESEVPKDLPDC